MINRDAILWTVVLGSPIVWLLSLEASFALAPLACSSYSKFALYLVSIASLAIEAGGGILAWNLWRRPSPQSELRLRGMALGGAILSGLFFVVILAQTIPNLMLARCE